MNIDQIKELIAILEGSKLNKLTLKDENGCEIHLEKSPTVAAVHHVHPQVETVSAPSSHMSTPHVVQTAKTEDVKGQYITSPMVGTFYLTPSPESPAFVKVGDKVKADSIVCIVEAMKVMNEIKAGIAGTIVEVCIANGHVVEFGTKLFRIEP